MKNSVKKYQEKLIHLFVLIYQIILYSATKELGLFAKIIF